MPPWMVFRMVLLLPTAHAVFASTAETLLSATVVPDCWSQRGAKSLDRLASRWLNIVTVHLPVHANWLNQIEIYFSIAQRKVLTSGDFASPEELAERLLGFQERYEGIAKPFEWRFTRKDLDIFSGQDL